MEFSVHNGRPGRREATGVMQDGPGRADQSGGLGNPPSYGGPDYGATIPEDGDRLLASRYRILNRLGSGGMADVWKARDETLDIDVAIKVVPAVLARHEATINALKQEARVALRLTHPAICRTFDFHQDGDLAFLVMELIEGRTLEQILADRPDHKMTWEELQPIAEQLAAALDLAHSQDPPVLHRDIKPANIMITDSGQPKLLDFGIARTIRTALTAVTGRQETSGTILYMSPEQFRGDKVDARSDIYSFCAVLYEALAGRPLVSPEGSIQWQILEKEFEPIAGESDSVNRLLVSGLRRPSVDRPRTLAELFSPLTTAVGSPSRDQERDAAAQPGKGAEADLEEAFEKLKGQTSAVHEESAHRRTSASQGTQHRSTMTRILDFSLRLLVCGALMLLPIAWLFYDYIADLTPSLLIAGSALWTSLTVGMAMLIRKPWDVAFSPFSSVSESKQPGSGTGYSKETPSSE